MHNCSITWTAMSLKGNTFLGYWIKTYFQHLLANSLTQFSNTHANAHTLINKNDD